MNQHPYNVASTFLNGLASAAGQVISETGKQVLKRAVEGAADGALAVAAEKLEDASKVVEDGKARVRKARSRVRGTP